MLSTVSPKSNHDNLTMLKRGKQQRIIIIVSSQVPNKHPPPLVIFGIPSIPEFVSPLRLLRNEEVIKKEGKESTKGRE